MLTHAKVGGYYYAQDPEAGNPLGTTDYRESWYIGPTNSSIATRGS